MSIKTILPMLALATALVAIAPVAHAAEGSSQTRDHRASTTVRDHRTSTTVRDHREQRRNEIVPVSRPKLDCAVGYENLRSQGYSYIHDITCEGVKYLYTAIKDDLFYQVEMNAFSGELDFTLRGFAH
jgi:hypothetical protein